MINYAANFNMSSGLFSLFLDSYNRLLFAIVALTMSKKIGNDKASKLADIFAETDIAELRLDLLRFAKLQLRDQANAEDAVQEALTAAYASRDRFAGKSQVKTWVFSILRNKIIDIIRQRTRRPTQSLTNEDGSDTEINELFDENGYWHKQDRPSNWGQPDEALDNDQFWRVLEICLDIMSESTARVFIMREFLGLETDEICAELEISESNCWVILHRARSRLRLCLEKKWIRSE